MFAEALLKFADHFLSVIGMLWILWMINWRVAAIALASLPFLCFTLLHLYRQTKMSLKKQRKQEGKVTSRFNEVLAAVPLVQAFGRERHEQERYEEVSNETLRESIRMTRLEAAASRSSHIMTAVGTAGTVLFGALEVMHGRMSPGDLVLVMSYLSSMYKPLRSLAKLSIEFSKASASAERIGAPAVRNVQGHSVEPEKVYIEFLAVSKDGGATWEDLPAESPVDAPRGFPRADYQVVVDPLDAKELWGFSTIRMRHSTDGGRTWKTISDVKWANGESAWDLAIDHDDLLVL